MKNFNYKKTVIFAIVLILSTNLLFGLDGKGSIISNGVKRTFDFHAPGTSIAPNLPVMIVMHGDGGTGEGIKAVTRFDAVADWKNFLAIYPDAIGGDWNRGADNAPGDLCTGSDNPYNDVLFISDLIDYLCTTYFININKVYATGHSAGGFMAYNLAIQLTSKIAAFAPVSASLCGEEKFMNNALAVNPPVPIYHIHGDADNNKDGVEYPDADFKPNYEWPLSAFSGANCKTDTYVSSNVIVAGVIEHIYCNEPKKISLIQIVGMGHVWPNVAGYNAAEAIADFCLGYSLNLSTLCTPNSVNELENSTSFEISPNPSNGKFDITESHSIKNIRAYNVFGNEIYLTKLDATTFSLNSASSGVYILIISLSDGQQIIKKLIIQ